MICLTSTSDVLRIVSSAAVALDVHASFVDNTATAYTPGRQNTTISTATTTTVVAAPAVSTQRGIKRLSVVARGGANTVVVEYFDGAAAFRLKSVALASGETLEYEDGSYWRVVSVDGSQKVVGIPGGFAFAAQADQETATSTVLAVNPAGQKFHPSATKAHGSTTGGGTPVLSPGAYNVSSIVDTAVGHLTVNFAVPFSVANYSAVAALYSANGLTPGINNKLTTSVGIYSLNYLGAMTDPGTGWEFACFGDQ